MKSFHISIDYAGKHVAGEALPLKGPKEQGIPLVHHVFIEGKDYGFIRCGKQAWQADKIQDPKLIEAIGNYIHAWYE